MSRIDRIFACEMIFGLLFLLPLGTVIHIDGSSPHYGSINIIDDYDTIEDSIKEKAMPLSSDYFIQNKGQIDTDEILFYSRGGDIFFTPTGVLYRFREMEPIEEEGSELDTIPDPMMKDIPETYHEWGVVLEYSFIGSNRVVPEGRERCSWNTNYFKGSDPDGWYTEVPSYMEVVYPEIWDGIDLVYCLKDGSVKYDLIVHPGADTSQIIFGIKGQESLSIDENGDLIIGTRYWDIIDGGLVANYAEGCGGTIPCHFFIQEPFYFGFNIESYDHTKGLVIDPVINFSTFIGGSGDDRGYALVIDPIGNVYLTGYAWDTTTDYPTTSGAYDTTHNGGSDVFVTKLNSTGSSLMYSTFIGGSGVDCGYGIAIDLNGNAYVTGDTVNAAIHYPTTFEAYRTIHRGGIYDVFVTKLNSAGSSLVYSTFIGGSGYDYGRAIAIDSSGNAYITGNTENATYYYPTETGSYDTTHNGDMDVFVTNLNSGGTGLIYSTFIGGSGYDIGKGIEIDPSGNVYVTGYSENSAINYPTTLGAYDITHNGGYDVFVTKLNSAGSSLVYSTFIGGSGSDCGYGIAIDASGNAYTTGGTTNVATNYPTTSGAYDTTYNGVEDVFVTKLNSAGSSLIYSTFIGGSGSECGYGIAIDASGNAYITGVTFNAATNYPTTSGAYDTTHNGVEDVFVTKLNSTGSSLIYSTFIGGSITDYGYGIAIDSIGNVYLTGETYDTTIDYPTSSGAYDTTHNGAFDVFVTSVIIDLNPPEFGTDSSTLSATTGDQFTFSIEVTDNIKVVSVFVEYWFGTNTPMNVSMIGSGPYTHTITVPSNSMAPLNYIYHANDTVDNWDQTSQRIVEVQDNDRPMFGTDSTVSYGTTGDQFMFNIQTMDNIGVSEVFIEYWFGSGTSINVSMSGSGPYNYTVTVPSYSMEPLHYIIKANDTSDNWNQTIQQNVLVLDNDEPVFVEDLTLNEGTTGDPFTIMVNITDNIGVTGVDVEYWYGDESHSSDKMDGSGPYTYEITIPSDSTSSLHYIFNTIDDSSNTNDTLEKVVTIMDNDQPEFGMDTTPLSGTTGETFAFNIAVTDNIGVTGVYVEYWYEVGSRTNVSMGGSGPYTYEVTIPMNSSSLHYVLHASDDQGNWENTVEKTVTIIDNDRPIFGIDSTMVTGTTGDPFMFNVSATDNIGVTGVYVEYWFGTKTHTNVSMSGTGPYNYSFVIPESSLVELHYIFRAYDSKGCWNATVEKQAEITDNDDPVLGTDSTPTTGTTGDSFTFTVEVSDNIEIEWVSVEYWYGLNTHVNVSMLGTGTYILEIDLVSSPADPLSYVIRAMDSSGNDVASAVKEVQLIDNDAPVFTNDMSSLTAKRGEEFTFSIGSTDNGEIVKVSVEYWIDEGAHVTMELDASGQYSMIIPTDQGTELHYRFIAEDAAGNEAISEIFTIDIEKKGDGGNIWFIILVVIIPILIIGTSIGLSSYIKGGKKRASEKRDESSEEETDSDRFEE